MPLMMAVYMFRLMMAVYMFAICFACNTLLCVVGTPLIFVCKPLVHRRALCLYIVLSRFGRN